MYFKNKKELLVKLKFFNEIGFGSQGTCYLDNNTNTVYKVFNQYLDEDIEEDEIICYNKDDIMRFSNIKNNTFIFPKDIIIVDNEITPFVDAKPLYKINPLCINLDKFINNIKYAYKDIEIITSKNVITFDLLYNTLYGNKFYVTDTDEFGYNNNITFSNHNIINFNQELYLFLIDGYFNEFVGDYNILKKMYNNKDEDILLFLKLLRKYLSEYIGRDIKYLKSAKKCLNKNKIKNKYQRIV